MSSTVIAIPTNPPAVKPAPSDLNSPSDGCIAGGPNQGGSPVYGCEGNTGFYFCNTNWKAGLLITGMEVWAEQYQIKGIQLTYSDGSKAPIQGNPDSDTESRHAAVTWAETDTIQSIQMWNNSVGDAMGRISLKTTGGVKLDVGAKFTQGGSGTYVPLSSSGNLIGMTGTSNDMLRQVKFWFLPSKVATAEIVQIDYDESLAALNAAKQ